MNRWAGCKPAPHRTRSASAIVDFARSARAGSTDWKSVVRLGPRGAGFQPARLAFRTAGQVANLPHTELVQPLRSSTSLVLHGQDRRTGSPSYSGWDLVGQVFNLPGWFMNHWAGCKPAPHRTRSASVIVDFARPARAGSTDWKSVVQRLGPRGAGIQPARLAFRTAGQVANLPHTELVQPL
jgi:hypothetical protein